MLPVVPYRRLEEALAFVNRGGRPLALYCFSGDQVVRDQVLDRCLSAESP